MTYQTRKLFHMHLVTRFLATAYLRCVVSLNVFHCWVKSGIRYLEDTFLVVIRYKERVRTLCGPGSVAIGYGLYGPGIKTRCGRDFLHLSRPALGPTQSPVQWVPGLFRGKERPGRDAEP